jgi:transketolase
VLNHSHTKIEEIKRGAYILKDCEGTPEVILIATGSEVGLALAAAEQVKNKRVRVVSMPSTTTFDQQEKAYQDKILPRSVTHRIAIEAAASDFWYKYVGLPGKVIGLNRFGESAPYQKVYQALGLTVENIVASIR